MSLSQFAPSLVQSPERPPCPDCGGKMTLIATKSHTPGIDRRSFRCKECGYPDEILVNFK
jgi:tRNA(Ile2) C34 agmatinyltransferase TiaS